MAPRRPGADPAHPRHQQPHDIRAAAHTPEPAPAPQGTPGYGPAADTGPGPRYGPAPAAQAASGYGFPSDARPGPRYGPDQEPPPGPGRKPGHDPGPAPDPAPAPERAPGTGTEDDDTVPLPIIPADPRVRFGPTETRYGTHAAEPGPIDSRPPARQPLFDAVLCLPRPYQRALLLYDARTAHAAGRRVRRRWIAAAVGLLALAATVIGLTALAAPDQGRPASVPVHPAPADHPAQGTP
ncbi:hypothetical protein ACFFHI_22580 [Streptomyces palmae]|uniref:hypothetical protein n=1 Tax=Streptomyces palmae TaxID=1701085 RepID=UPI0035EB5909